MSKKPVQKPFVVEKDGEWDDELLLIRASSPEEALAKVQKEWNNITKIYEVVETYKVVSKLEKVK